MDFVNDFFSNHEAALRLGSFLLVLVAMIAWEYRAPRRPLSLPRAKRWPGNLGLVATNTLLMKLLLPLATTGVALYASAGGWGLFNQTAWHPLLEIVLAVILLDMVIYWQHVIFHRLPPLWRLHRVHHADTDYDVTTGSRFHPIEILLSMLIKFLFIVLLGPSLAAVVLFEILLNATAMFNHANVALPTRLDRLLRYFLVTPDMHRVHHSIDKREQNRNFGFNLPWWDYLFGSYQAQPQAGHQGMVIGLTGLRDRRQCQTLIGMWGIPFMSRPPPRPDNEIPSPPHQTDG